MNHVMMTVKDWGRLTTDEPQLPEFCQHFGVKENDVDMAYGLIMIRPSTGSQPAEYVFMIDPDVAEDLKKTHPGRFEGPFSNPVIGSARGPKGPVMG